MSLRFYYAPLSCALATHIVLEHIGADYEAERLNLRENDQNAPGYLAINPKGTGSRARHGAWHPDRNTCATSLPRTDLPSGQDGTA